MSLVKWIAVVGGKQYSFSFKDIPYGADMGEGLDYFLDEVYDGGPEGNDWEADTLTVCCPKHWQKDGGEE